MIVNHKLSTSSAKAVLWVTLFVLSLSLDARAVTPPKDKAQPRTTYSMPSGRGWAVCESYLKLLKATAASDGPPLCDFKFDRVPGMSEPNWEVLDVANNLPIVHQIELILGIGHIDPNPEREFESWKLQREQRIKSQDQTPRLRRTKLALVPGGPVETILSYDQDVQLCKKEVDKMERGIPNRSSLGEPNFFVFDEATQRVLGGGFWHSGIGGYLKVYLGSPYYFDLYVGLDHAKGATRGTLLGYLYINRLETWNDVPAFKLSFPKDPPYNAHELCLVRFEHPVPVIRK